MASAHEPALPVPWSEDDQGQHYEHERFASPRAAGRDLRLVQRALQRFGRDPLRGRVLDAPCGTGRLYPLFQGGGYVGLDCSLPMLNVGRREGRGSAVCADLLRLPFPDRSFDLVVACRILHHARDEDLLHRIVAELVRVSQDLVIASFFDRQSWHAWRKRRKGKRGRVARDREQIETAFNTTGARILGYEHSLRFWSQQAFVIAQARTPEEDRPA